MEIRHGFIRKVYGILCESVDPIFASIATLRLPLTSTLSSDPDGTPRCP